MENDLHHPSIDGEQVELCAHYDEVQGDNTRMHVEKERVGGQVWKRRSGGHHRTAFVRHDSRMQGEVGLEYDL
jgi:hypothetical protein